MPVKRTRPARPPKKAKEDHPQKKEEHKERGAPQSYVSASDAMLQPQGNQMKIECGEV